jgi:hypothetical protein
MQCGWLPVYYQPYLNNKSPQPETEGSNLIRVHLPFLYPSQLWLDQEKSQKSIFKGEICFSDLPHPPISPSPSPPSLFPNND